MSATGEETARRGPADQPDAASTSTPPVHEVSETAPEEVSGVKGEVMETSGDTVSKVTAGSTHKASGNTRKGRRASQTVSEEEPRNPGVEEQMETGAGMCQEMSGDEQENGGPSELDIGSFSTPSPMATSSVIGALSSSEEEEEEDEEEMEDSDASVECAQRPVSGAEDSDSFSSGKRARLEKAGVGVFPAEEAEVAESADSPALRRRCKSSEREEV